MSAPQRAKRGPSGRWRKRRTLGAEILVRTLADRRVLIRKLVIGEAIGERPRRGLYVPQLPQVGDADDEQKGDTEAG